MKKRAVLWGSVSLVVLPWLGLAGFLSWHMGGGAGGFLTSLILVPAYGVEAARDAVQPDRHFGGLDDARAVSVLKGPFGHGIRASDGRMLYDIIVENGYRRGLDIGTAKGYSSLWLALAMKKTGGTLTTIEIDPETAAAARENFRRAGLDGVIDARTADALTEIPALAGQFDFVFIDPGVPGLNNRVLDVVRPRLARGGTVAAHNAMFFASEQPEFLRAINRPAEFRTRIVRTVSGGISISVKAAADSRGGR